MSSIGKSVLSSQSVVGGGKPAISKDPYADMKDYIDKARVVALNVSPFIYSILSSAEIRVGEDVPIAGVSRDGVLMLNPDGMRKHAPTPKQAVSIFLHEALHIGLSHFDRLGSRNPEWWNIATDTSINEMLEESGFLIDLPFYKKGMLNPENLAKMVGTTPDKIKGNSAEENYYLIEQKAKQQQKQKGKGGQGQGQGQQGQDDGDSGGPSMPKEGRDLIDKDVGGAGKDKGDKEGEGGVLQKGAGDVYKDGKYDVKKALGKAKNFSGFAAGTMPAGLKREIDKLLEEKIDWRTQMKEVFKRGFGGTIISSWARPSRRFPSTPGKITYTYPTVWALVDTSGSIGEEQLKQAMTELYGLTKQLGVKLSVIPWDAEVHDILVADNPTDVVKKVSQGLKGGGGTTILPTLKFLLDEKKFKRDDAFVIISDGEIFDLGKEAHDKLETLSRIGSSSLFLTSGLDPEEIEKSLPSKVKVLDIR